MSCYKRSIMILLLVWVVVPCGVKARNNQPAQEDFFEANRAYKNGLFREAANGYLRLTENGFENGTIYYNLGNTHYRMGELGEAILYYERARLLIPRDDDLIFNLSHARNQAVDATGDLRTLALADFLGLDSLNLYEVFFVFTVINILFFFILGTRLYKKTEWSYYLSIFLAIFVTIGASILGLKWYEVTTDARAVVLSEEVEVHAGPDSDDTVLFKIHEGTVVRHERFEGDWVLLQLSEKKRGWARSKQLGRIVR